MAVPILIHLINLRRQQRIRWAAMQFLLESQRRNRRWILLKQLLLLLARMAAIAVLVLMLAHLVLRNEWLQLLGPRHDASPGAARRQLLDERSLERHHVRSAKASGPCRRLSIRPSEQSDTQLITLLRFSEAARLSAGAQPKVFAEPINDTFRSKLESLLAGWDASQTDVGPGRRAQGGAAAAARRQ